MGMSTRSKTGATPPPRIPAKPTISKSSPRRKSRTSTPRQSSRSSSSSVSFPTDVLLYTDEGSQISTSALITSSKPGLILFTYPRANTPGCTTQACALRDALPDLSPLGYHVWGLSYDKPKSQASWRAKHSLGYGLLCDTLQAGVIKSLGAHKPPKSIKRSVFVVTKDGVVWNRLSVSPKDTVPLVMEYVTKNPLKIDTNDNEGTENKSDPPMEAPEHPTHEKKDEDSKQQDAMEDDTKKDQESKDEVMKGEPTKDEGKINDDKDVKPKEAGAEDGKTDDVQPKEVDMKDADSTPVKPKQIQSQPIASKPVEAEQVQAAEGDTKGQTKPTSDGADAAQPDTTATQQADAKDKPKPDGNVSERKAEEAAKGNMDGDGDHAMEDVKDVEQVKDGKMSGEATEDQASILGKTAEERPEPSPVVTQEKKDKQSEKAKEALPEKLQDTRSEPVKTAVNGN